MMTFRTAPDMGPKLIYLAPVAFTSAGVTALISSKLEDPRTKQILNDPVVAAVNRDLRPCGFGEGRARQSGHEPSNIF